MLLDLYITVVGSISSMYGSIQYSWYIKKYTFLKHLFSIYVCQIHTQTLQYSSAAHINVGEQKRKALQKGETLLNAT